MKCDDYDLRNSRDLVFDRLYEIWRDPKMRETDEWKTDIWRKANTLQAVAQY